MLRDHWGAIEADLMRCGYTLDDLGARLPWRALFSFVSHPAPTSALFAELQPEYAPWLDGRNVAALLADVYDAVQGLTHAFVRRHARKGANVPAPKPYPRPWLKSEVDKGWKHFGGGALPRDELDAWFAARQTEADV